MQYSHVFNMFLHITHWRNAFAAINRLVIYACFAHCPSFGKELKVKDFLGSQKSDQMFGKKQKKANHSEVGARSKKHQSTSFGANDPKNMTTDVRIMLVVHCIVATFLCCCCGCWSMQEFMVTSTFFFSKGIGWGWGGGVGGNRPFCNFHEV